LLTPWSSLMLNSETTNSRFSQITNHYSLSSDYDKHLRNRPSTKLTYENSTWLLNTRLEKKTCWLMLYQGSRKTPSTPLRNKTSSLRASILQKTTANFKTLLSLSTTFLFPPYQKKSQWFPAAASTSTTPTATITSAQAVTKTSDTTSLVPISTMRMTGTRKITTISRKKKCN